VGPRLDGQLLAAIGNHTGGMLAIDNDALDAKAVAKYLGDAIRGIVFWPSETAWPKSMKEVYPARMPPLRTDRDTIVLGKGKLKAEQKIEIPTEVAGQSVHNRGCLPCAQAANIRSKIGFTVCSFTVGLPSGPRGEGLIFSSTLSAIPLGLVWLP
jgi:hypothetical protein